jgi:hypothetical protein
MNLFCALEMFFWGKYGKYVPVELRFKALGFFVFQLLKVLHIKPAREPLT